MFLDPSGQEPLLGFDAARNAGRPSLVITLAALGGALFGGATGGDDRLLSAVVFAVLFAMGAWVLRFVVGLVRELLDGST